MNNELKIFENPEFGQVRTVMQEGDPWFVGADVCNALGFTNPRKAIHDHVDAEDKGVTKCYTPGGKQTLSIINESGVYALVFGSKLESAKRFKHWITSEVLPSVRKHGAYMTDEVLKRTLMEPDTIIQIAMQLKQEKEARLRLEAEARENEPKVFFAEGVSRSSTCLTVGEMSKILRQNGVNVGQNRLFDWLRRDGYLMRKQGTQNNVPTQRAMEMGLFRVKETVITHSDGKTSVSVTPLVTGKGQLHFMERYRVQLA